VATKAAGGSGLQSTIERRGDTRARFRSTGALAAASLVLNAADLGAVVGSAPGKRAPAEDGFAVGAKGAGTGGFLLSLPPALACAAVRTSGKVLGTLEEVGTCNVVAA
jgi:hypothetical protein